MNMTITTKPSVFKNEPFTDFTVEANKVAMEKALEKVKGKLGEPTQFQLVAKQLIQEIILCQSILEVKMTSLGA